ncbi:MAG: hypothetical protein LBM38_06345 [Clostridiales bacterium]|jgi:hypothetical protein|nr:hypothetical protein [Clostridiales bacterium]
MPYNANKNNGANAFQQAPEKTSDKLKKAKQLAAMEEEANQEAAKQQAAQQGTQTKAANQGENGFTMEEGYSPFSLANVMNDFNLETFSELGKEQLSDFAKTVAALKKRQGQNGTATEIIDVIFVIDESESIRKNWGGTEDYSKNPQIIENAFNNFITENITNDNLLITTCLFAKDHRISNFRTPIDEVEELGYQCRSTTRCYDAACDTIDEVYKAKCAEEGTPGKALFVLVTDQDIYLVDSWEKSIKYKAGDFKKRIDKVQKSPGSDWEFLVISTNGDNKELSRHINSLGISNEHITKSNNTNFGDVLNSISEYLNERFMQDNKDAKVEHSFAQLMDSAYKFVK